MAPSLRPPISDNTRAKLGISTQEGASFLPLPLSLPPELGGGALEMTLLGLGTWARRAGCELDAWEPRGAMPRGRLFCHPQFLLLPPSRGSEALGCPLVVVLSLRCRQVQGNNI